MYEVIDVHSNQRVAGPYASKKRACHKADKLDSAYGAIRYFVREVR